MISNTTPFNVLCFGGSTGSATANGAGGTGAYTYSWSNLQGTQTATGLSQGNYTVTVTDNNGCTSVSPVTILQPTPLLIPVTGDTACSGQSGTLSAAASGGTGAYTYLWNPGGVTGASVSVSPPTTTNYTVTVTDNNGCTNTAMANMVINPSPTAAFIAPNVCINNSTTFTNQSEN